MGKLLKKEMKLTASPLSYWFILFSFMTFLPGYPILVGGFFVCLGIFFTYQQAVEYDDITFSALLPIRKKDVVKAKYAFVIIIQMISFVLSALFTVLRMTLLSEAKVYLVNQMMNANLFYLGFLLLVFAVFNTCFMKGFFKTAYRIGKPFIIFCIAGFLLIGVGEMLHHLPGMEALNSTSGTSLIQAFVFLFGIVIYVVQTLISMNSSERNFEKIDL